MTSGDQVLFDARKNFTYKKQLGKGGAGETHLFLDETTDTLFAIKKLAPYGLSPDTPNFFQKKLDFYNRFKEEIKLLFNISHPNIVRIYNYYLYPVDLIGYIQMEYIDGDPIDSYIGDEYTQYWDEWFIQAISAFSYLESKSILHRDIRPGNLLIDENNRLKLIDFGFGKNKSLTSDDTNSIILNWPATAMPKEVVNDGAYNEQTEIYFLGVLFKHLISQNTSSFSYVTIIDKMINVDPTQRYNSFVEIEMEISQGLLGSTSFSDEEKMQYRTFADSLCSTIAEHNNRFDPEEDIGTIIDSLSSVVRKNSLEVIVQNNADLLNCFLNNNYRYYSAREVSMSAVMDFYSLLVHSPEEKQKVIIDNLKNRLSNITVLLDDDYDELPF